MKEWIPFFQAMLWPLITIVAAFLYRKPILGILDEIKRRISEGSGFEAGPSGVKLGQIQQPVGSADIARANKPSAEEGKSLSTQRVGRLYLVHTARRDKQATASGEPYYQLRIYLDGDSDEDLAKVQKVVYHLHPTFPIPVQTRTDRRTSFEVRTKAWGEFNLWAEVFLDGQNQPLILERYLNL